MVWSNNTDEGTGRHRRPRGAPVPQVCTCGGCAGVPACPRPPHGRHAKPYPEVREVGALLFAETPVEPDDDRPLAPVVPLRRPIRWRR
jgi:hypothetical protein